MTSSNKKSLNQTRAISRRVTFPSALRRTGAFWLALALLCCATATAAPGPIEADFDDNAVLMTLPDAAAASSDTLYSPAALTVEIQRLIDEARRSGDPRFLGYAERLFKRHSNTQLTDSLLVLRATLAQSLHRFESARQDLQTVLERSREPGQRAQALITLANIEIVQGNYTRAQPLCDQLTAEYPGLIAASCHAQVAARSGAPRAAYDTLAATIRSTDTTTSQQRLWAEGTLGDIAAQLGERSAIGHWYRVLNNDPDDLYTRAQLADWHLQTKEPDHVLAITEGYEAIDTLAITRAIAMRRIDHPGAQALALQLRERFDEALWRGSMLHQRDLARFELDIEQRPKAALQHAMANWDSQREPQDTRLALRAATAAQDDTALQQLHDWLRQQNQTDNRYPEGL